MEIAIFFSTVYIEYSDNENHEEENYATRLSNADLMRLMDDSDIEDAIESNDPIEMTEDEPSDIDDHIIDSNENSIEVNLEGDMLSKDKSMKWSRRPPVMHRTPAHKILREQHSVARGIGMLSISETFKRIFTRKCVK